MLGHFAIVFRLIFGRLLPARRPRRRWLAQSFRRDLREVGLGVVQVPEIALGDLRAMAEEVCAASYGGQGDSLGGGAANAAEPPETQTARGLNGAFPSSMAWHWAADEEALEPFRPVAESIKARLGDGFELIAGSFVVARGGCQEHEAKFHLDFGPPAIPSHVAATALMPLFPQAFPRAQGNLEFRPWNLAGTVATHPYKAGEAAVFDGKLAHRTQPFAASAFAGETAGRQPLAGLRVLASFSFAKLPGPWSPTVQGVLQGYGAPVLPPLLNAAGAGK